MSKTHYRPSVLGATAAVSVIGAGIIAISWIVIAIRWVVGNGSSNIPEVTHIAIQYDRSGGGYLRYWHVGAGAGGIYCMLHVIAFDRRDVNWARDKSRVAWVWGESMDGLVNAWSFLSDSSNKYSPPQDGDPLSADWHNLGFRAFGFTGNSGQGHVMVLPDWLLIAVALCPPLIWLRRGRRVRKRVAQGLCARCGYDLRSTPARCPECGTVPPERDSAGA